jgi:glucose-1-phosphate adenylyltransferase
VVGYGTVIEDSIVLPNAIIGRNCRINKAIINEGAVVDDNTVVGDPDGDVIVFGKAKLSI